MKLTFCGAAQQVTGSCYLLETATKTILIDCGLFQGGAIGERQNLQPFPFKPSKVDVALLTHGHLDHCGRLPKLVCEGFNGKIIATGPTVQFAKLILKDSVHILAQEAERHQHNPIFTEADVEKTIPLFEEIQYHTKIKIDDQICVEFFNAGHILGAAIIRISVAGKLLVFSGDLGNSPAPIINNTKQLDAADIVVMESTYGGRVHEDSAERSLLLQSVIYETIIMKGVLMIPAFAIERTQELLFELNNLVNNKDIPAVPIFLDSPLAIKATAIFKNYQNYFNVDAKKLIGAGDDLFDFPGLKTTINTAESKAINNAPAPKVIIAGSGMAQGGRILHHLKRYIGFYANHYLIIGYQVQGSLGRCLLDGAKKIKIHGQEYAVQAKITAIGGYSAHADQPRLLNWARHFDQNKLQKVFLTHGETEQIAALKNALNQNIKTQIQVPQMYDQVEI